jgi:hypothetical protein
VRVRLDLLDLSTSCKTQARQARSKCQIDSVEAKAVFPLTQKSSRRNVALLHAYGLFSSHGFVGLMCLTSPYLAAPARVGTRWMHAMS